jgi:hypothetical protein
MIGRIGQGRWLVGLVLYQPEQPKTLANAAYQDLCTKYPSVFADPSRLPPDRAHNHRIPLLHGAPPANVRPYRYPQIQKEEIERAVREMMESGIIRNSVVDDPPARREFGFGVAT